MKFRKFLSGAAISAVMLCASLPAKAGIPVIDAANLAQAIQEIIAWGQQANQMIQQLNQLRQQFNELQRMNAQLAGARNLGSILNNPAIQSALPVEMRNSAQLLLTPSALGTSSANITQILNSFGVDTSVHATAGQATADTIGRLQQMLASTEHRGTQLRQLASRVDSTADAKESMDMVNRNVLEAASVNNQMTQTMAALEAARQAAELKRLAEDQAYFTRVKNAAAAPLMTFSY